MPGTEKQQPEEGLSAEKGFEKPGKTNPNDPESHRVLYCDDVSRKTRNTDTKFI